MSSSERFREKLAPQFHKVNLSSGEPTIAKTVRTRINRDIRVREVRVIGESGEMLGVMLTKDALDRAREAGMDLVEISPNAEPPVVKIIDWGKYQYQQAKAANLAKKSSKGQGEVKEMRIGLKIGQGDLETKLNKVRGFLADGSKVKIQVVFKGREMAHKEIGFAKLDSILEMLSDVAVAENKPTMGGRFLNIMVRSKK